ncbi:MAG: DUF5104 domain-containing protein [Clostridia bacterium]|nr:DUF5104 domain-containing protein [Clostridia bacterium]
MLSAIKSLLLIILAVIGLALSLLIGFILLIRGILKKPLAEYAGSTYPKKLMITGIVMILIPFAAIAGLSIWGITSSANTIYTRAHYECVPDIWRNESVSRNKAEEDIIRNLLASADKGNREAFAKNFTPEIQKKKGFDKAVVDFFENYPGGLAGYKIYNKTLTEPDLPDSDSTIKTDSLSFRCGSYGEWYFVVLKYCYYNPDEPDKVGVTEFRVMNLEAAAVYYENEEANTASDFPVCDIRSGSDINARLVGGRAYLWTDTDTPKISEEELRGLVELYDRLDDPALKNAIGEPNLIIKETGSNEYGYFFELTAQNGEPRYAYVQTDSERGKILWALICTPYEVQYNHTLVEYKKQ